MAKTKKDDVEATTVVEEVPLVRRDDALPIDPSTGAPKLDAPAAVAVTGDESTSHVLAKMPGSSESTAQAHIGGHRIRGES